MTASLRLIPAAVALVAMLEKRPRSTLPTPGDLDLQNRIGDVQAALRDAHRGAIDRASASLVKSFCERGTPPSALREEARAAIVAAIGEDVILAEEARGQVRRGEGGLQ